MQQKNFILFILLSFAIFIIWVPLQHWLWPPLPAPPAKLKLPDQRLWASLPWQAPGIIDQAPTLPGLAGACRLVADYALTDWAAGDREGWYAQRERKQETAPVAKKAPEKKPVTPAVSAAKHREITLGNDKDFNIQATVTSDGGGIQRLILPGFDQADRLGRSEHQALNLIPDDRLFFWNAGQPSFALNHFAKVDNGNPADLVDTLGRLEWTVDEVSNNPEDRVHKVVLKANPPPVVMVDGKPQKVRITKIFTLGQGDYHLGLELQFQLDEGSDKPVEFFYQLAGPLGLPVEGDWYTRTFRNAVMGGVRKGNPWRAEQDAGGRDGIGTLGGGHELRRDTDSQYFIRFAGIITQYFASMIVVDNDQENKNFIVWTRPTLEWENPGNKSHFLDEITARVNAEVQLKPGVPVVHKYLLYNGPTKVRLLKDLPAVSSALVSRYETTLHLNQLTDYGSWSFWTDLIIFFTNLMHSLLWFLHSYIMPWSYGLCILMLTVLVRGAMFPLSRRQAIASAKLQAKMQEMKPEIQQLEVKYKSDPMELQRAKHELMLKRGIGPTAFLGSCWILLLQLPIFMGLYFALYESIHFRLAPFLWIQNLSAPDMLFEWGEKIPYISTLENQGSWYYLGPFFNILPICWVVLQLIQQKMMMPPAMDEQTATQQKMMKWMMILFAVWFYKVPAGLCLYFIASGLWTIAERKLLPKAQPATTPGAPPSAKGKTSPPGPKPKQPKPSNGNGTLQKVKDLWEKVLKEAKKK